MSKQFGDKRPILRKVFLVLLILDAISLIMTGITLFPTFKMLAGYGLLMLVVTSVIAGGAVAVLFFEILAKVFLIRSTSPAFSWSSGRKGYVGAAKFLFLFNLGAVIINLLSAGGEGANLLNQGYLYLRILAAVIEMIAVFFYLRTVKKQLCEVSD